MSGLIIPKKYNVNAVDHINDKTDNNCNLTVLGNDLKSFLLSSNKIVAVSINQFLISQYLV